MNVIELTMSAATISIKFKFASSANSCNARHGLGLYIYAGEDLPEEEATAQKKTTEEETIKELKDLYKKAGGKDFDKWVESCGGLTPATYPNMKATLLKQINAKAEGEKK